MPGFMCDHALWDAMTPRLAEHFDLIHADLSRDAAITAMAARALDGTPDRFALAGFSMGGYVAREMALTAPDRVTHLALINTSARGTTPEILAHNRGLADLAARRPFTGLTSAALRKAVHPDRAGDEDLKARLQAMAGRLGGEVFSRQLTLERADGLATLSAVTCPTLVVWSRFDVLRTLDESEELAHGIPAAHLAILEDSGHMTPMEQPGELADLLLAHVSGACP